MNFTVSFAALPGSSVFVFLPPILKSCEILPLLITVKITVPVGTLRFEKTYLNSDAFTVTLVVASAAFVLAAPAGRKTPASTPASSECRQPRDPGDTLELHSFPHLDPSPWWPLFEEE